MKKQVSMNILITVVLIAMTVTFSITMIIAMNIFDRTVSSANEKALMYDKIAEVDGVVRQNYFGEIPATLNDRLAAGYIAGIQDAYAKYYTAEQYSALLNRTSGKTIGIGVDIVKDSSSGYARVVRVYGNTPANEVGIEAGWYIVTIDGQDVKTLSKDTITSMLMGEAGTQVEIGLLNGTEQKTVTIVRKSFEVSGIEYAVYSDVGLVRITRVTSSTAAQFDYAIQRLIENGATSLVFDLRNLSSTSYEEIARMLDVLCPAGTLISAQYKDGTSKVLYTSNASEVTLPMVCVTNGATSGAPEIFCQVLKDYGKARIVGTQSAGRGSLQTFYRLSDGSAVEITTSLVLTPVRGLLEGGVMPDYEATLTAAQEANFYSMSVEDDPQLCRAFEVAAGLVKNVTVAQNSDPASDSSLDSSGDSSLSEDSSAEDSSLEDDSSDAA